MTSEKSVLKTQTGNYQITISAKRTLSKTNYTDLQKKCMKYIVIVLALAAIERIQTVCASCAAQFYFPIYCYSVIAEALIDWP